MRFPIIDLHEDLLLHLRSPELSPGGVTQTSFELLEETPVKILLASAFPIPPEENYLDPVSNEMIEEDFRTYRAHADTHEKWRIVKDAHDVTEVLESDGHGIVMHVEGLNVLDADPWPRLDRWYDMGWRSLGIVWNVTNPLGGGVLEPDKGLTALGADVLRYAEEKKILVDFAHMNPAIFKDALEATTGPIFISHGNTCEHCPTPRNYNDEQLRQIAERGGVIGPFFSRKFLVPQGAPAPIESAVAHFTHMRDVVGVDHIALGTDFGGILSGFADGLTSLSDMENLWAALHAAGFTEGDMEKIAWRNAARFLTSALPS